MNVECALKEMGVKEDLLTSEQKRSLDEEGYLVLPGLLSATRVEALRARLAELLAIEKGEAGKEVHQEAGTARLSNLVDKGEVFRVGFTHPLLLAAVAHVLGNDLKLSAMNSRAALPGQGLQPLHADWGEPVPPGEYKVCNSIWLLDDFTKENGATRFVVMTNPAEPHPDEQLLLSPAGTMVIFNSHLWHGGTVNRTDKPRRAMHSYWTRRALGQQLNQRKHMSQEKAAGFSAAERFLLEVE